ncbi:hypothetical protein M514_13064 [Trichuris suis]|uniref:protein-tyrosine-phosphatase n=1 Tax=Trichuris suis TaxID=68888 RepID=A0A085N198_9BILA|nr:hypothetical protein M514_13064 [Trichuris suis]
MEATRPTAEPSPATISAVQKFLAEVDSKNRDAESSAFSEYAMQFLKIRLESDDFREMTDFTCDAGGAMENLIKNRYRDVLPYDFNRVKLRLSGSSASDYINASYINGCDGRVGYIATQGPLEHTVDAFWSMIAQCRVKTIIMLCELVEDGKTKCSKYWPSIKDKKSYGNVKVSLVEESKLNIHYTVRRMALRQDNEKREVKQFHFHQWPDHSTPEEIGPLLDFLELVREHQPETNAEPLVVHCSAGCGRTGTFCALDYARCLFKTEKLPAGFSVYGLVYDLRKQRPAMVQTRVQHLVSSLTWSNSSTFLLAGTIRIVASVDLHVVQTFFRRSRSQRGKRDLLFDFFIDGNVAAAAAAAVQEMPAASTTNDGGSDEQTKEVGRNETTTTTEGRPPSAKLGEQSDNASSRQNACNSKEKSMNASPEMNEVANSVDKREPAVADVASAESSNVIQFFFIMKMPNLQNMKKYKAVVVVPLEALVRFVPAGAGLVRKDIPVWKENILANGLKHRML